MIERGGLGIPQGFREPFAEPIEAEIVGDRTAEVVHAVLDVALSNVCASIAGIRFPGISPFASLNDWAQELRDDASRVADRVYVESTRVGELPA